MLIPNDTKIFHHVTILCTAFWAVLSQVYIIDWARAADSFHFCTFCIGGFLTFVNRNEGKLCSSLAKESSFSFKWRLCFKSRKWYN
jgi:hypothetical protein